MLVKCVIYGGKDIRLSCPHNDDTRNTTDYCHITKITKKKTTTQRNKTVQINVTKKTLKKRMSSNISIIGCWNTVRDEMFIGLLAIKL